MVLLTMIARVADGLPLAASMQEDEQSGRDLQQYQSQAKQLFRKLNEQSPNRCTLEAGSMSFHYVIEHGVCYLALCEAAFPKKLAFAYLEDLQAEFHEQYGNKTPTSRRQRSRTSTAGHVGTWAALTQSCMMCRGSWWPTSRRCCSEERPSQLWTPRPATCPASRRSTAVTRST
ncbi:vesicle-trafficking protein SEC22b-B-like isoform X1 [Scleropages formosus]|uniref:vesicle-trafficking protein SEC22b-B-like isoform X1 n=1 Tax=Scleropages formosus TaxID=113540 RepID=UPI000878D0E4|nr:vesicle-trafficking protein SEC22b-B-like isoform X1 [Scleropages formosus]